MQNPIRILCVFVGLLFTISSVDAQVSIGPRIGIKGSIPMAELDDESFVLDAIAAPSFGVQVEVGMTSKIGFVTGVNWNARGFAITLEEQGLEFKYQEQINYLDLPLLMKIKLGTKGIGMYLNAGATFGYAMTGSRSGNLSIIDGSDTSSTSDAQAIDLVEEDYKRFNAAAVIGAGVYFKTGRSQVFIDANMDYGLTPMAMDDEVTSLGIDFGVGILVPLGK
ncbi:MAG: PorT family protein [Saprospiraceae bacterium]|nr:PorT family protein [Saprospiraceae bacterium]